MWNSIEVLSLLQKDFTSVLIPIVSEMAFDFFLEVGVDVETATVWLVLDAADQVEPLLKFLLILALTLTLDRDNDVLELVHQDREEGNTEDLNDTSEDFFHDRLGAEISIAYCRQSRQRIVHASVKSLTLCCRLS